MQDRHTFNAKARNASEGGAHSNEFMGKRVLVVGMARSGIAAAELLCTLGATPMINDMKQESAFGDKLDELKGLPCEWYLGVDSVSLLDKCDMVVLSPGVPIDAPVVTEAAKRGVPLIGELEFASEVANGTLVAVTGTNGKTTTVSLLGEIFRGMGKIAYVAGNVGYPLSAAAMQSKAEDVLVAEVSSFQLETVKAFHPVAAAVLNITEDHMNRHHTMECYTNLKKRVFENQNAGDVAILNYDDPACRAMAKGLKAHICWFSRLAEVDEGAFVQDEKVTVRWDGEERAICGVEEIRIPGPHNLENALAATAMAYCLHVPPAVIRHTLRSFAGVEHRIEFVREVDGVRYINDSKGTNVDSTIKAVDTMRAPTVLLMGGYDKHVSFDALSERIKKSGLIKNVVLIGATADQIDASLRGAGYDKIYRAKTLEDAVAQCRSFAEEGGNVLFSPACASFDMFSDYEARGRIFKQIVNDLK